MAKLWEYDEFGEPWLENGRRGNPPLIIVNPKRKVHKKGKKRMAKRRMPAGLRKYWAKHRRKSSNRKRSPARRRRRTRRNPWPMAGTVAAVNRKRSRRRGRKHSSRRRRGYRRNPALLGISLPPLQSVIYAGVGFVGVPIAEGFLSRMLPVTLTGSTIGKYATRIGALLGLSFLTKMVLGSSESRMVAIGGGAYVLTSAISEFAPGLIPAAGMRAYRPATLGAYAASTRRQLGAPDFGAQNTVRSAGAGGANIVAQRFRRFQ